MLGVVPPGYGGRCTSLCICPPATRVGMYTLLMYPGRYVHTVDVPGWVSSFLLPGWVSPFLLPGRVLLTVVDNLGGYYSPLLITWVCDSLLLLPGCVTVSSCYPGVCVIHRC